MIAECFNPECRRQLEYLRTGRVVRVVHQNGAKAEIEHFWLCGECCRTHDMQFLDNGSVALNRSPERGFVPQSTSARLIRSA